MSSANSCDIDKHALQKLLHKIVLKRFFDNLTKAMQANDLKHVDLSKEAGRIDSAFNKTFNRVEDIGLSSFLRYWHALNDLLVRGGNRPIDFQTLIDEQTTKILELAIEISLFGPFEVAKREKKFFLGLKAYVDGFIKRKVYAADSMEVLTYQALMSNYINEEEDNV